jgi:hypothetical protein
VNQLHLDLFRDDVLLILPEDAEVIQRTLGEFRYKSHAASLARNAAIVVPAL